MKTRSLALDVIRSIAFFCVISVHFFLNCEFYQQTVDGSLMYVMITLRNIFIICVPLFLLLSGYLMCNKTISVGYYLKVVYTLFVYVAVSVLCILYNWQFHGHDLSLYALVFGTTNFSNAPYSWYIEMYLGLFLIIPFLNVLYNGLSSKKEKQLLLLIFLVLTALPAVMNTYCFRIPGWWAEPASLDAYKQLIPSWWVRSYPITYYFLGCYLREYPLKMKRSVHFLLIVAVVLLSGLYNYYRSWGHSYVDGAWQDYPSLIIVILSVLVFTFFLELDYSRVPAFLQRIISCISKWSLGGYLLSWIFDTSFYPILNNNVPLMKTRLLYFPVIVGAVAFCSLALSALIDLVYKYTLSPLLNVLQRKLSPVKKGSI